MEFARVEKIRPHVSLITLDRPQRLNAMSYEMMRDTTAALDEVAADNSCWVVILTGEGNGFCSGLDLEDPGVIPGIDEMPLSRIGMVAMSHFSKIVPAMRAIPQPVIAAINGPAYGGGMCLSLGADVRYASDTARFNMTGIVNGLSSGELGATFLLPRLIGASRAHELMLTGRVIDAAEACRIGLVSEVVASDELLGRCLDVAAEMCEFSAYGLQLTKKALWDGLETTSLTAAIDMEDRNQLLLGNTENLIECVAARKQDRKPVYTDMPRQDLVYDPEATSNY